MHQRGHSVKVETKAEALDINGCFHCVTFGVYAKLHDRWPSIFMPGFRMGKGCGHRDEHRQMHGFR